MLKIQLHVTMSNCQPCIPPNGELQTLWLPPTTLQLPPTFFQRFETPRECECPPQRLEGVDAACKSSDRLPPANEIPASLLRAGRKTCCMQRCGVVCAVMNTNCQVPCPHKFPILYNRSLACKGIYCFCFQPLVEEAIINLQCMRKLFLHSILCQLKKSNLFPSFRNKP